MLQKLGDGLMALFGYPRAQENDAERAVRAALAIQRALVEINARNASRGAPELQARIGLDSGQVVVDATGEVFGDAPNIAARVQIRVCMRSMSEIARSTSPRGHDAIARQAIAATPGSGPKRKARSSSRPGWNRASARSK